MTYAYQVLGPTRQGRLTTKSSDFPSSRPVRILGDPFVMYLSRRPSISTNYFCQRSGLVALYIIYLTRNSDHFFFLIIPGTNQDGSGATDGILSLKNHNVSFIVLCWDFKTSKHTSLFNTKRNSKFLVFGSDREKKGGCCLQQSCYRICS